MPSFACNKQAVEGNIMSGVTVVTITKSISSGFKPAFSRARLEATSAMSLEASLSAAILRSFMPDRV